MMNYTQAVQFHEDTKKYGSILGLDSIRTLMHELGDVWRKLKIVHVAGTNGKGSVCCFLASVFKEAGYITGQFNSPAVFDLREIYQVNGTWISREEYAFCMEQVKAACERMLQKGRSHPTVFEIETALAFLWFSQRKCDIVILETGMGGKTDATNLIEQPLCSVFTSICLDHMDFLGDSIAKITEVKAGIIKRNCPVVTTKQLPEAEEILRQKAKASYAAYHTAPEISESRAADGRLIFSYPGLGEIKLSMTGSYQTENAALAVKTLQVLAECGYSVTKRQILKGMEKAKWSGRFECLSTDPLFYIDGAHNTAAAEELKISLTSRFPNSKRIGIMGVMADKPYREMLKVLHSVFEEIYTVTPDNKRALPAEKLAEECRRQNIAAMEKESIWDAVKDACERAGAVGEDVVVTAFGSLYYLKEVKYALYKIKGNAKAYLHAIRQF